MKTAGVLLFLVACGVTGGAQSPRVAVVGNPAVAEIGNPAGAQFDVASVRVNGEPPNGHSSIWSSPKDGNFKAANVPLKMLLSFAYGLPESRVVFEKGAEPGWVDAVKFDIMAKSDAAVDAQMAAMSNDAGKAQKQAMLQALFAERFGLKAHRETRELPVYELVASKGGAKLVASTTGDRHIGFGRRELNLRAATSAELAAALAQVLERPVIDKTGEAGQYDVALKWARDDAPTGDGGPSIFTAVEEQLGLKLVAAKGPVEVLVVEHVEMPSAN